MKKTLGLLCCLAACAAVARTPEEMKEDVNVITNRILAYVHGNTKLEAMRNFAKFHKLTKEELQRLREIIGEYREKFENSASP